MRGNGVKSGLYGITKGRVRDMLVVEWLESNCDWVNVEALLM